MDYYYKIKSILFGIAIGDALGVPVENIPREVLKNTPVTEMKGFLSHYKPPGTFSDDSSLTFTLVESLIKGYDLDDIAQNMVKWLYAGFWTADGEVFDVGGTTRTSLNKFKNGIDATLSGESDERSNGNGSLMRIAPLVFILFNKPINERFQISSEVSSITHAHSRSVIACFYFLEFLRLLLLDDLDKYEIYHKLQKDIPEFFNNYLKNNDNQEKYGHSPFDFSEIRFFDSLLNENIYEFSENEISSSGYVIDTIEASVWCLLNTENYHHAVLKAVNLGSDTDTTATVTGALSGLLYGFDNIPKEWVEKVARSSDIDDLAIRFAECFNDSKENTTNRF